MIKYIADIEPIKPEAAIIENLSLPGLGLNGPNFDILRLDRVHPVISGNKWYKLKYHFQDAVQKNFSHVLTYGGAWSNHVVATACMAHQAGLFATGIIRGEMPAVLSHTLRQAADYGMDIQFLDRATFKLEADQITINDSSAAFYRIPQGGAGEAGVAGSMEILSQVDSTRYTHIMCCIGTGTMFTGIARSKKPNQQLIGIPVLKGFNIDGFLHLIQHQLNKPTANIEIFTEYHFGGYAMKTPALLSCMNRFYEQTSIRTDFVYTGKLIFAAMDLLKKGYFPDDSCILLVHSGGLQGNASLPAGTLIY